MKDLSALLPEEVLPADSTFKGYMLQFEELEVENSAASFMAEINIFRSVGVEPVIDCRGAIQNMHGSLTRPAVRTANIEGYFDI